MKRMNSPTDGNMDNDKHLQMGANVFPYNMPLSKILFQHDRQLSGSSSSLP